MPPTEELQPGEQVLDEPVLKTPEELAGDTSGELPPDIFETGEEQVVEGEKPPEKEEKPEVNFDDFLTGKISTKEVKTAKTEKKAELPKEEKVEEKKEIATEEHTEQEEPPKKPIIRDFSGLTEKEVQLAKRMPTEAFQWVEGIRKRAKAAEEKVKELETQQEKGGMPRSYYQHPEAFKLSKEFNNISENVELAQTIQSHWERQALNIKAGKDWQDLDVNEKGQIVFGKKMEASDEAAMEVNKHIRHAENQLLKLTNKAEQFVETHRARAQKLSANIKEQEDQYFPHFKDEKFVGWTLANDVLTGLDKLGLRDNPLAVMLAKAAASNTLLVNYIKKTAKQGQQKVAATADAKRAGPVPQRTGSAPTGGQKPKKEVTMDDFAKVGVELNF